MATKKSAVPLKSRRSKQTPGRASKVLPFPQRVKFWQAGLSTLSVVLLGFVVWGLALASSSAPPTASNSNTPTLKPSLRYDIIRGRYYVSLAWSTSAGDVQTNRYVILRNNQLFDTTQTNSYQDFAIQPGVTYTYQVRAVNSVENVQAQSLAQEVTVRCAWLICQFN